MSNQLPLLVQEKVDYYKWRTINGKLLAEYYKMIFVNSEGNVTWQHPKYSNICETKRLWWQYYYVHNSNTWMNEYDRTDLIGRFVVENYVKCIPLPARYYYSSGFDSSKGYRLSKFQRLLRNPSELKRLREWDDPYVGGWG